MLPCPLYRPPSTMTAYSGLELEQVSFIKDIVSYTLSVLYSFSHFNTSIILMALKIKSTTGSSEETIKKYYDLY